LRAPEMCKTDHPQNVLINLNEHVGPHAEAKCLSINPVRPELLAVGANDPYVRLYDRRMLHCRGITFPADTPARLVDFVTSMLAAVNLVYCFVLRKMCNTLIVLLVLIYVLYML